MVENSTFEWSAFGEAYIPIIRKSVVVSNVWASFCNTSEEGADFCVLIASENKLNGLSTQWFKNGIVQALAKYKDNQFVDTLKFFFSNGKPNYIKYFTYDGLQNGKFIIWHQNGNISQLGYYIKGKEDGEWKTYYEDGKLETTSFFRLGKRNR